MSTDPLTAGMLVRQHGCRALYRVVEPAPTPEGKPQGWWMIGQRDQAWHAFNAEQVRPVKIRTVRTRKENR